MPNAYHNVTWWQWLGDEATREEKRVQIPENYTEVEQKLQV